MRFLSFIGRLSPFLLAVLVPLFLASLLFNLSFISPVDPDSQILISVEIPERVSHEELADILAERGLVRSAFGTKHVINKISKKKGENIKFKHGEYEISPALSPHDVIEKLLSGQTITRNFIVLAGLTFDDVAKRISDAGLAEKDDILKAMKKRDLLIRLRVGAGIPEGYFIPGGYTFTKPISPEAIIEELIKKGNDKIAKKFPNLNKRLEELKIDYYTMLIMASMIELESNSPEVKAKIASVFYNRYLLEMPIKSVPALAYFKKVSVEKISEADTKSPNPYNTFLTSKLPATPLCASSLESIDIALNPETTDFLYYFKDSSGEFYFSKTQKEHEEKQRGKNPIFWFK